MGGNVLGPVLGRAAVVVLLLLVLGRAALAQQPVDPWDDYYTPYSLGPSTYTGEFSGGVGYAHFGIGGSDSVLDSENALRFDFSVSFSPVPKLPQLRLGGAVGVGMVFDDSDLAIISSGGVVIVGHSTIPLWLIEPEVRLSWRQPFGDDRGGFFVEPGVGVGALYASLSIDGDETSSGRSFDESDTGFMTRAFVNIGFRSAGGLGGIQLSYARAESIDLAQNASGDAEEFYIGVFGSLRF